MKNKHFAILILVVLVILCTTSISSAEAIDNELIIGQEIQINLWVHKDYQKSFYLNEIGDILSDNYLTIQVVGKEMYDSDQGNVSLHIIPLKIGTSTLGGVNWRINPREEMPEELLGNWQINFSNGYSCLFFFRENGEAGFFITSSKNSDSYELMNYSYYQGIIQISKQKLFISQFHVEDGIPIPDSGWEMKRKPVKLADSNVVRLQNCSIEYVYPQMPNSGLILLDPDQDAAQTMAIDFTVKKKPSIPQNASLIFHINEPEILEVADYSGWSVYLHAKKAGTAEISVQPGFDNSKESNTLSFTVLEGQKSLPDDLVGVRWVHEAWGTRYNVIFDQKGTYIAYLEYPNASHLYVKSGSYLYRDGVIQMEDRQFRWFYADHSGDQNILNCYGTEETGGIWTSAKLMTGSAECINGTYLFTDEGAPKVDTLTWDELCTRYRFVHEVSSAN